MERNLQNAYEYHSTFHRDLYLCVSVLEVNEFGKTHKNIIVRWWRRQSEARWMDFYVWLQMNKIQKWQCYEKEMRQTTATKMKIDISLIIFAWYLFVVCFMCCNRFRMCMKSTLSISIENMHHLIWRSERAILIIFLYDIVACCSGLVSRIEIQLRMQRMSVGLKECRAY